MSVVDMTEWLTAKQSAKQREGLIIYLGDAHIPVPAQLMRAWEGYGHVYMPVRPGSRPDGVIGEVYDYLHQNQYSTITVIGAGMWGLRAYDLVRGLTGRPGVRLILVDAPAGKTDLHVMRRFARFIPRGMYLDLLSLLVAPQEPQTDNTDEQRPVVLSTWVEEVQYVLRHPPLAGQGLRGIPVMVLSSTEDEIVSDRAVDVWMKISDCVCGHYAVHSGYLDFSAQEWEAQFIHVFNTLREF